MTTPPLWPLVLAMAAGLFITRIDIHLILLAVTIASLLYAIAGIFTTRRSTIPRVNPSLAEDGTILHLPAVHGVVLAALALFWLFASVLWSTEPSTSLWFTWMVSLLPLAYLASLSQHMQTLRALATEGEAEPQSRRRHWHRLGLGIGVLLGIMAAWGVTEFVYYGGRSNGPFLDFNAFGALFYLAAPPAWLAWQRTTSQRMRSMLLVYLALCLLALFATASRGAIGVLLLLVAPLLLGLRRSGMPWRTPAMVLLALISLAYGSVRYLPESPTIRPVANLNEDKSTQDRLRIWRATLNIWRDYPQLGVGLGNYKLHYPHYRNPEENSSSGDMAHNDYLQVLAEGGPGLLGILLITGAATLGLVFRLWRKLGPSQSNSERQTALSGWVCVLPVLGLFIHAGINFIFYVPPLALLAGLLLAHARVAAGELPTWQAQLPVNPRLLSVTYGLLSSLLVGAVTMDGLAWQAFNPDNRWPIFAEQRAEPLSRYHMASIFATLRPNHIVINQTLTAAASELAMADHPNQIGQQWAGMALIHAKAWLAVSQGNPYVYAHIGQLLWLFPSLAPYTKPEFTDQPRTLLTTAVDLDPASPEFRRILANYLVAQHKDEEALQVFMDGQARVKVSLTPERVIAWKKLLREAMALADKQQDKATAQHLARTVSNFDPDDAMVRRILAEQSPPAEGQN